MNNLNTCICTCKYLLVRAAGAVIGLFQIYYKLSNTFVYLLDYMDVILTGVYIIPNVPTYPNEKNSFTLHSTSMCCMLVGSYFSFVNLILRGLSLAST